MKPSDYAKAGTEHSHQVAVFMHFAQNRDKYPETEWMFAIPNGGERNVAVAGRLKAEGVKSGVSDICLPVSRNDFHGLFLEMKKPKTTTPAGTESAKQKEFGAFLKQQNYFYVVCDHWEVACSFIERYLDGEIFVPV